jgi:hypothetical protein
MAFEKRKTTGPYFYLGVRDPATRKVRKVYLGRGAAARTVAASIAEQEARREAGRRAVREARDSLNAVDALTAELDGAATLLMEAVFLAGGWHRPNYGPWRRKRDGHGRHESGPAAGRVG